MVKKRLLAVCLVVSVLLLGITVHAQVSRPYSKGSVWEISFIRIKPGMDQAYKGYLVGAWKAEQEAMKKENLIVSYKVLETEAHGTSDWNMLLMTEYKDLASMEANEAKMDALSQRVSGDDAKQMQGFKDRAEIREVFGTRIAREVVLQPRS